MVKTHTWEVTISTYATLTVTPATGHDFGNVAWKADGTSCGTSYAYTVSNTSSTPATITISTPSVEGYFTCQVPGHTCGVAFDLAGNSSVTVNTNFCPKAAGTFVGVMRVVCAAGDCASGQVTIERNLSGVGINTTIGIINPNAGASTWDPGPFPAGSSANVASVSIMNDGNTAGTLQYRCYIYANEAGETLLLDGTTSNSYPPGGAVQQPMVVTIPASTPSGQHTFGVKVKGQTETTWPAWGALGTIMWDEYGNVIMGTGESLPSYELDAASILLGGIGAVALMAVLFWKGKK